jgi:hypothetical protein
MNRKKTIKFGQIRKFLAHCENQNLAKTYYQPLWAKNMQNPNKFLLKTVDLL